ATDSSVARYRQSLLAAAEESFSERSFLTSSLPVALLYGLKRNSDNALFDGTDDSELPFGKLLGVALALAKEIKKQTKKQRVGIILPPGKGGMIANLAVLFANKIPVNLNFTSSQEAVRSCIRQAEIDKFITADPFVRKVPNFPWPPNRELIFIERVLPQIKKSIIKWAIAAKLLPASVLTKVLGLGKRHDKDEAILLFTSGSSGDPKGVPLTHRNLLANVCQFASPLDLPENASILGSLPLFHSFGCTVTLWYPIIQGLDLVTYPSPLETKRLAELIEAHRVDLLLATPTFLRGYMRRIEPEQLKSLKLVVTGAEKLPDSLAQSFEKKFGILPMEGYGLTETSPATNVNLPEASGDENRPAITTRSLGSVGSPLPGLAVKVTNLVTEKEAPLDQSGVIWFKGANIFPGYLNQEELSQQVLKDGWFRTGDVGRMDSHGMLYIEGRTSRFSKIAGEMVPHESVEASINQVLGLDTESERKIAVIGVPDEKKGEAIVLLSTIAGPALEQENLDIRYKLLDQGVPSLWCPREIFPVKEIPVLASGKLDIKACQALYEK
ncbi:MAG: AMP-binding protein, partial [Verrucomicrobiales bacterium]